MVRPTKHNLNINLKRSTRYHFCPDFHKFIRLIISSTGEGMVKELLSHTIAGNINWFRLFESQFQSTLRFFFKCTYFIIFLTEV